MPPKAKITEKEIINAAVQLVREQGAGSLNARALANCLGCSTQPIFSNFASMEEVLAAVIGSANELYNAYLTEEISGDKYPPYKASGMGYIRFAREEKELFKLLFMRDRSYEPATMELKRDPVIEITQRATGYSYEKAERFHLEMWATVHGIGTMQATSFLKLDEALISDMITDVYQGLLARYKEENG